jgi:hypothetical protein
LVGRLNGVACAEVTVVFVYNCKRDDRHPPLPPREE